MNNKIRLNLLISSTIIAKLVKNKIRNNQIFDIF